MSRKTILNEPEDLKWLGETHLRGVDLTDFESAVLSGNEDCPTKIQLFGVREPTVSHLAWVYELKDDGSYVFKGRFYP